MTAPRLLSNVRGSGQGQKTCKMHAHSGGRSTSTAGCQAGRCWRDWHSAVRTLPATRHARLLTDTRAEGRTAHPHLAHVHNHHSAPRGVSRAHRIQTKRMTKLTPTVNVMMPVRILSRASTQQQPQSQGRSTQQWSQSQRSSQGQHRPRTARERWRGREPVTVTGCERQHTYWVPPLGREPGVQWSAGHSRGGTNVQSGMCRPGGEPGIYLRFPHRA